MTPTKCKVTPEIYYGAKIMDCLRKTFIEALSKLEVDQKLHEKKHTWENTSGENEKKAHSLCHKK